MKKLLITLAIFSGHIFALDTQINVGTLGVGLGLSQQLTDHWGIAGAIDYRPTYKETLSDVSVSDRYSSTRYTSSIDIKNTTLGLGAEYYLFSNKSIKLSAEGGVKLNMLDFDSSSKVHLEKSGQIQNAWVSDITTTYNKIAPYLQANVKYYLTNNLYMAGQLGVEYINLKVTDSSTGTALKNEPLVAIAGIGIGYSF